MLDTLYILPALTISGLLLLAIDFNCKKEVVYLSYTLFSIFLILFAVQQYRLLPVKKDSVLNVKIVKGEPNATK